MKYIFFVAKMPRNIVIGHIWNKKKANSGYVMNI